MATIVLGISGSIAAYKAADIASALVKQEHTVHCVCTQKALEFVTALTLHTISRNPVFTSFEQEMDDWVPQHIKLAQAADLFVIAPASANTIANMTHGLANDALGATYLACSAPVLICPAMHTNMWQHPATRQNIDVLRQRTGHHVFGPAQAGVLACGAEGPGKLMPVSDIVQKINELLSGK